MRYRHPLGLLLALGAVAQFGCMRVVADRAIEPLRPQGAYAGRLPTGEPIVLRLEKGRYGWRGVGRCGGQDVVFEEGGSEKVVGKLIFPNGTARPAALEFSRDGKVALEYAGAAVAMKPGRAPKPPAPGPFTGEFVAEDVRSVLDALYLSQSGTIISGTAVALQQKMIVRGWPTGPNSFRGIVTLPGEAEMEFTARLEGQDTLIVSGVGAPVAFHRR